MQTEQPTKCFIPLQKLRVELCMKTSLSSVVLFPVWCQSLGDVSPHVCSYYFSSVSVD